MQEWYTQQELADMFGVSINKVRNAVAALRSAGAIVARERPEDRRIIEVHRESVELVRKASTGQ